MQLHQREDVVSLAQIEYARGKKDIVIKNYPETTVDLSSSSTLPSSSTFPSRSKIAEDATELIGGTPMVKLTRFAKAFGLECELVGKCEFMGVGGSVKDRIAKQMVSEAEKSGRIKPGDILVEASSGNTGIGICLVGAVKGYGCVVTMPKKMSKEKQNLMERLGAQIIRTPTSAAWNDIDSHITLAHQLEATIPECHFLDQYANVANPRAHYLYTAEEILTQCNSKIDMFVCTAGTGGTITGMAHKIKETIPKCCVVGVDPRGSILAEPSTLNEEHKDQPYFVEGIGYDFIPSTLNRKFVDKWVKIGDEESFFCARELMRLEGLFVGGSSGSALAGALQVAKDLKQTDRCVVVLPDSARNYMEKFVSDTWMINNGFLPVPENDLFKGKVVGDLKNLRELPRLAGSQTVEETIPKLKEASVVVVEDSNANGNEPLDLGILTPSMVIEWLSDEGDVNAPLSSICDKTSFKKVFKETPLKNVAFYLKNNLNVIFVTDQSHLLSSVTQADLLSNLF